MNGFVFFFSFFYRLADDRLLFKHFLRNKSVRTSYPHSPTDFVFFFLKEKKKYKTGYSRKHDSLLSLIMNHCRPRDR